MTAVEFEPIAFLSYSHSVDQADDGRITEFRERLEREVAIQAGRRFAIFQDRRDIRWGEAWRRRIELSLDQASFLLPIITPAYFRSTYCRDEMQRFIEREQQLGRGEIILPVYYVTCREIEGEDPDVVDDLLTAVKARQYVDWRDLRFADFGSEGSRRRMAEIAATLVQWIEQYALDRSSLGAPGSPGGSTLDATEGKVTGLPQLARLGAEDVGLQNVFQNWTECQEEVLGRFGTSSSIRVFLQMGKSVLSGAATIYRALQKLPPTSQVRILHAGAGNPYLGEMSATRRDSDYREWREDVNYAARVGERLHARLGPRLQLRNHSEGYLWRLFIFDDVAYVQPYLYERDNANIAPVLRFSRYFGDTADDAVNPNSLYGMFSAYFNLKWEECAPKSPKLEDRIRSGDGVSVVASVRQGEHSLFVIPRRFVGNSEQELPFHSIGGKKQRTEGWVEALQREAIEEIGAELEIKSARFTRELTTSAEFDSYDLDEDPRPYCIYRRTRDVDPEVMESEVLWIVGYEASLAADVTVEPLAEIAAVLCLTNAMLSRTARERVTYDQIRKAKDGSRVTLQAGLEFDWSRIAVPTGLAALPVLASRWRLGSI